MHTVTQNDINNHLHILNWIFCLFQDLVKSHLMFAVREEVEVLKEKIAELMERINQLEVENSFLRSQASPETLAQLANQTNNTSPPSGPVS